MEWFIGGIVGIPIGGLVISSVYHWWRNETCIFDTKPIYDMIYKMKRSWVLFWDKFRKPQEYIGDGLIHLEYDTELLSP